MYAVYILKCADQTLYTGVTNDIEKRLFAHNHLKTGAKYTSSRRPVCLVYSEYQTSRSDAQKREYQIKSMSREEKLQLISSYTLTRHKSSRPTKL